MTVPVDEGKTHSSSSLRNSPQPRGGNWTSQRYSKPAETMLSGARTIRGIDVACLVMYSKRSQNFAKGGTVHPLPHIP